MTIPFLDECVGDQLLKSSKEFKGIEVTLVNEKPHGSGPTPQFGSGTLRRALLQARGRTAKERLLRLRQSPPIPGNPKL
jgi:hypothetical protein